MTTVIRFTCKRCRRPAGRFKATVEHDTHLTAFVVVDLDAECDHEPPELEDDGALSDMVRDAMDNFDGAPYEMPSAQSESGFAGSWDAVMERVNASMRDGFGRRL